MKKGKIIGLVTGVVFVGLAIYGVLKAFAYLNANREVYGLDDDFEEDDFSVDDFFGYEDFDDAEDEVTATIVADDIVSFLTEDVSDEDLARLGIIDRSTIDFEKLPINVLNAMYKEITSL